VVVHLTGVIDGVCISLAAQVRLPSAGCLFDVWLAMVGGQRCVCVSGLLMQGCEMPCARLMWSLLICV
jgi:hypothetical protein